MSEEKIIGSYEVRRKLPENFKESDAKYFINSLFYQGPVCCLLKLRNAHILNNAIFHNFYFYRSYCFIKPVKLFKLIMKIWKFILVNKRIEKGFWCTDEWGGEYFHWFTDVLPRLLIAGPASEGYRVILPFYYKERLYIQESLSFFQFEPVYIRSKRRTVVKNFVSVSHTALTGNFNPTLLQALRDRFIGRDQGKATRKIYISREKARIRRLENEVEVQKLVREYDYEIILMEEYPWEKQIQIAAHARTIVGLHGAGLTNMLFMPEGSNVLELRRDYEHFNNCFFHMANALNHRYYYTLNKIISSPEDSQANDIGCFADLNKLKEALQLLENF